MITTTMATVPACVFVEFKKIVTKGCCVPFESTASRSPAQKMTVMPATKPMAALEKYERTSDQGMVQEASLAFSAVFVSRWSEVSCSHLRLTHVHCAVVSEQSACRCQDTDQACSGGIHPATSVVEREKHVARFPDRRSDPKCDDESDPACEMDNDHDAFQRRKLACQSAVEKAADD